MKNFEWHSIIVTNDSIEYKVDNQKFYIPLEQVDGAEVAFVDHKLLLVFAVISFLGVFSEQARVASIFGAIMFSCMYFATRKLTLQVHAGNMKITRVVSGKNFSEAESFIENLKMARRDQEHHGVLYKKEA